MICLGGREELRSRFRSALSPWIDLRNPADVVRDRLEEGIDEVRRRESRARPVEPLPPDAPDGALDLGRPQGREIARGLTNYSSAEARLIARKASGEFERVLGYAAEPELIHRDNLVLA